MPQNTDFIKHRTSFLTKHRRLLLGFACALFGLISGPLVALLFIGALRLLAYALTYPLLQEAAGLLMFCSAIVCVVGWALGIALSVEVYESSK